MKNKKYIVTIVLVAIACLIIGGSLSYIVFNTKTNVEGNDNNEKEIVNKQDDNNDKEVINKPDDKDTNNKNEVVAKYNTEKFYFENLSKDGYGFLKVYYDDHVDILQLNKNGENKTIMSFDISNRSIVWNEPFHMQIVGNKFNFEITYATDFQQGKGWQNKNTRIYSIDLDTLNVNKIIDSNTFELTYDEYAISDKYIFLPRAQNVFRDMEYKIFRYDLSTLKEEIINDQLKADDIFIFDSKLYLKCSNENYQNLQINNSEKINSKKYADNYFSMDFDGNNITAYTENEYNEIKAKANYISESFNSDEKMYFLHNGNKVFINNNKLLYNDEVLYNTKKDYEIELYYTDKNDYVAIYEYKMKDYEAVDNKWYLINLNNKEITEVNNDEVLDFSQVLY